jgi:hypothetical protein
MLKAVYDVNSDNIVDNAEALLGMVPPASGNATATEIVLGSDSRLSDARPPTSHAVSHITGIDRIPVASSAQPGLMASPNGSVLQFYASDGSQKMVPLAAVVGLPAPVGDMVKATYDTNNSGVVDNAEALLGHVPPASGNATATQVVLGNDTRLVGGGGDMLKSVYDTNNSGIVDNSEALLGHVTPSSGNAAAAQVVLGSDTRLSDTRTPLAHEASHVTGADQIPNASTSARGLMPQADGSAVQFYASDGTQKQVPYSAVTGTPVLPSPVGDMTKAVYDANASGVVDNAEALLGHVPPSSGNASGTQVVLASDTRLADNRTPLPHAITHLVGADQLPLASSSTKGLLNQTSGNVTDFIDGTNNSRPLSGSILGQRPVLLGETTSDAVFPNGIIVPRYANHPDAIWTYGNFDDHFDSGSINAKWVQTVTSGTLNPIASQAGSKLCLGATSPATGPTNYSNSLVQQLPAQVTHQISLKASVLGFPTGGTASAWAAIRLNLEYGSGAGGIEIEGGASQSQNFNISYLNFSVGAAFGTLIYNYIPNLIPLYWRFIYDASKNTTISVSSDGFGWFPLAVITAAQSGFASNVPTQFRIAALANNLSSAFIQVDWIKHV